MVISALFFGFGHRGNPGATWVSSLAIAVEAGALLAAAYVATRSLWMPIGLHWAWNLFEGPVWGTPVSGIAAPSLGDSHGSPGHRGSPAGSSARRPGCRRWCSGPRSAVVFIVLAIRREQIVTPAWMWWIAGRFRRTTRSLLPVAPAPRSPPSTA